MTDRLEAEAAAAARIAANPTTHDIPDDSRGAQLVAHPPGWTHEIVVPDDSPKRPQGTITTRTAAGFHAELTRLSGPRTPVIYLDGSRLVGHPDPTSLDQHTHDAILVTLAPQQSAELTALRGAKDLPLASWERFVEDIAFAIDAADQPAPSAADVLQDARTWDVEVRRTMRRIKAESGDEDAVDALEARVKGAAINTFKVSLPLFEHGAATTLIVRIDRNLERQTITARVPMIDEVIRRARDAMFADAAELGGWNVVV